MKLIPIKVECYAGAKADETPRRFIWEEMRVEVGESSTVGIRSKANPSGPVRTISNCGA